MAKTKWGIGRPAKGTTMNQKTTTTPFITIENTETDSGPIEAPQDEEETTRENLVTVTVEIPNLLEMEAKTNKPWVDVIQGNRSLNKGMSLGYVAPMMRDEEIVIQIEEDDVAEELEFWKNAIVLFALGETPSMNAVKKFMEKT
ncbi:unnamed protein product [Vicia faba]|uniref:Uncharacterized protein n=1 Tax=Vicia faba TaxID=3906 RepID=A0AAV0ZS36_VICFA|nr:unnamed protein product [Vicia faba]